MGKQKGEKIIRDFIFTIGPSAVGKTTLAKKLFQHYRSVYVEQNMVPEFLTLDGKKEITGGLEEETCWVCTVGTLMNFHNLGYKNVIGLDFDDLRTQDIPELFKGYNYITLKLVCSDYGQNEAQMLNRGEGLIDTGLLREMNDIILLRKPLVNEFIIDVKGKTADDVFNEAVTLIDTAEIKLDYNYIKLDKKYFYSWVWDNGLRTI